MQDAPTALQIQEPLPPLVQYSLRYKATQTSWKREVEMRVIPLKGPPAVQALFQQELRELSHLDHPAFPPVLGFGKTQGRPYFLVPYRGDPTLAELEGDPSFSLEERCQAVRSLAGALAALHLRSCTVRHLSARTIGCMRRRGEVRFLHHRAPPPPGLDGTEDRVPADCKRAVQPTVRADLFHWGWLSYRLLTSGKEPYLEPGGELVPLHDHLPALAPQLAAAVERCLERKPERRPTNGAELQAVLESGPENLQARRPGPSSLDLTQPGGFDYDSTVADLRLAGRIPESSDLRPAIPEAPPPTEEPVDETKKVLLLGVLFVVTMVVSYFFFGSAQ